MPADPLTAIARDLAALAGSDRRAILAGLDADERDRLQAAMRGQRPAAPPRPAASGSHSEWFEALIAAARNGEGGMAPAARAALLDGQSEEHAAPRAPGRTLLQAAGGLLAAGKSR